MLHETGAVWTSEPLFCRVLWRIVLRFFGVQFAPARFIALSCNMRAGGRATNKTHPLTMAQWDAQCGPYQVAVGDFAHAAGLTRALTFDGDAMHDSTVAKIIVDRVMQCAAIVPHGH